MNRFAPCILVGLLKVAVGACGAQSGEQAPHEAEPVERDPGFFSGTYLRADRTDWVAEVEANTWYVAPGGDVSIGGVPLVDTARLNLDSPRATPMVEVQARFDPFTLSLRGSLLDVNDQAILPTATTLGVATFAASELVNTSYRLDEAVARLGYRMYQFDAEADQRGRARISAGVDLLSGLRLYDGSVGVSGPSGSVGSSFTHLEPLVGIAADVTFADRYEIQFQNTYAGTPKIDGQRSFSLDIQVTFKYRPFENAGVQVGYRIRRNFLEGDDYELDGAVAGVFAGLTLRF